MIELRIYRRFLELIECGKKSLEIRVGYDRINSIRPGAELRLVSEDHSVLCQVVDVRRYPSFVEMLRNEDVEKALPGMCPEEALRQLRQIYPHDKERLGVVVLDVRRSLTYLPE